MKEHLDQLTAAECHDVSAIRRIGALAAYAHDHDWSEDLAVAVFVRYTKSTKELMTAFAEKKVRHHYRIEMFNRNPEKYPITTEPPKQ